MTGAVFEKPRQGLVRVRSARLSSRDVHLCAFACDHAGAVTLLAEDPVTAARLQSLFPEAHFGAEGAAPDVVFGPADEAAAGLAEAAALGARFVPVPAPLGLPDRAPDRLSPARAGGEGPRRVCLFGPESTGKSTLGAALATHDRTLLIPEYGRCHIEVFGRHCDATDIARIVQGHLSGVRAAARFTDRLLIEDTDPVLTAIWSDVLTGARDPWFETFSDAAQLYLLTGIDVPFMADGVRYFPDAAERVDFHRRCRAELVRRGLPFVEVTGDRPTRLATAVSAIARMRQ